MSVREGERLTPVQVAFWAIGIGWLFLLVALVARRRLGRLRDISSRGWLVLIAMGAFGWAGYPVAINFAYTQLSLPDAMVIGYLNPVFVTLFQGTLFGSAIRLLSRWEQIPDRQARRNLLRIVVGLVAGLVGVALIATEGRLSTLGAVRSATGALAAVFAALCWGVYSNLGRFVRMRPGCDPRGLGDVQNFAAMAVALLAMGIGLGAGGELCFPAGYRTALYLGGLGPAWIEAWVIIAVMGLLNYCAGYSLWLHAVELGTHAGEAHKLPPLTYLVLVFAVILGWVVLHESFGSGFWQGASLIAAGNVVSAWPGRRQAGDGSARR
jgi:drug/metabolite transporter (DMT)-like permease